MTNGKYRYYSRLSVLENILYQKRILCFLSDAVKQYPAFYEWFDRLFYPDGTIKSEREIIFYEMYGTICGVIILKKKPDEKKVCTLRVDKCFRHQGISMHLLKLGFEWLGCDKPLITVSSIILPQYEGIFEYFGFTEEDRKSGYYNTFSSEHIFNGALKDNV